MNQRNKKPARKQAEKRVASPLTTSQQQGLIFALFIITATLLAYLPVWHAGFIWDDDAYVTNNPTLRSLAGLQQIWCNPMATPQYYPLVHTSFWVEYHLWGLNPLGYHIVNVLLHTLAALLLWQILARLKIPGGWLAAAIFALHPVAVESVAWVTERKNVLAAVFYFAAALAYWRWREPWPDDKKKIQDSHSWYFMALALFIAALFSKTVTCSLPATLLLVIWWQRGRIAGRDVWPLLPFLAAGMALGLTTSWLERTHVGAQGPEWAIGFSGRCLVAGRALWFYVGKLFWPAQLTFIYPRWQINAGIGWPWLFPAAALAVVAGLWGLRQRIGRGPLTAVLFFAGTLFPALGFTNIFPMRYSFVADHFQYLASVGLIILAAVGLVKLLRPIPFLAAVLPLGLTVLTWRQAGIYSDQETLWRDTLAKNPAAWMAHNNLGNTLCQKGRLDEAIVEFKKCLAIKPDYADADYNLGNTLLQKGQTDVAIAHFQKALAIEPDSAQYHNNLALAFVKQGRADAAIREYATALHFKPDDAMIHYNLGIALGKQDQTDDAIREYQTALRLKPDYHEAHNNLGHALYQKGRVDEAIVEFQKTLAIKPDYADADYNLGIAFDQQGRRDEAIREYETALRLKPDYAEARYNLGNNLLQKGQVDAAIVEFQKTLALKPDYAEASYNLGNALLQKGQVDAAIVQFQKALAVKPDFTYAHNNLGAALLQKGQVDEAIVQFQKALAIQPDNLEARHDLARIAWALATSPDASIRNGTKAVELARPADRLGGGKNPELAATLAAAYAEAGKFPEAVTAAQRALQLAASENNAALTAALKVQLKFYQAGLPYRDTGTTP
jgi:tetratricopeptide (TPR) repeat protein